MLPRYSETNISVYTCSTPLATVQQRRNALKCERLSGGWQRYRGCVRLACRLLFRSGKERSWHWRNRRHQRRAHALARLRRHLGPRSQHLAARRLAGGRARRPGVPQDAAGAEAPRPLGLRNPRHRPVAILPCVPISSTSNVALRTGAPWRIGSRQNTNCIPDGRGSSVPTLPISAAIRVHPSTNPRSAH